MCSNCNWEYEAPDERDAGRDARAAHTTGQSPEYQDWLDTLTVWELEGIPHPHPDADPTPATTPLDSEWRTSTDPLQDCLQAAHSVRTHSHHCHACGGRHFPCLAMPCAWRPFDRDAAGRWWACPVCRDGGVRP